MPKVAKPDLPPKAHWLFNGFRRYCLRYARKHFHAVRITRDSQPFPAPNGEPRLFVVNHPSWWDIIICMLLTGDSYGRYAHYAHYAPIEAKMLEKYGFFRRLGFFGVDSSVTGTKNFLRAAQAIFAEPNPSMWITAQGSFTDARVRPTRLRPGIGHVAASLKHGVIIPIALEYVFWNESNPEALIHVGESILLNGSTPDKDALTREIETRLETAQDRLAQLAIARDPEPFRVLVDGKTGVGGIYDFYRTLRARLTGRKPDLSHMEDQNSGSTREFRGE
jgi:1-acyl-sn-glycerol-3-phosphate acyltransferase